MYRFKFKSGAWILIIPIPTFYYIILFFFGGEFKIQLQNYVALIIVRYPRQAVRKPLI